MGWILRAGLALVAIVAALALVVWTSLTPPAPLPMPVRGATLSGVTLINPGYERRAGAAIVVEGERIASISDAEGTGGEYAGHFVLPGLSDMHVHFPPAGLPGQTELFAFLFLYHGVTTVRDAGDVDGTTTEPARSGIANGDFPGPRVLACGPFVDGDPPLWRNSKRVVESGDGRRAVEEIKRAGFDCVKAYNELSALALAEVRDAARTAGLPVIGHVPRRLSYEQARLDDVQHLFAMQPPPADPDTRFPLIMKDWARLDEPRINRIVKASLEHGIANTPTLVTTDMLLRTEHPEQLLRSPDARLLPRFYSEVVWSRSEGLPGLRALTKDDYDALRVSLRPRLRMVGRLHQAGVRLHLGSDVQTAFVVPGISLQREMRLFADAGLTPEEVWAIGTRGPAQILADPQHGRLAPGARADLLVFAGDPTEDLAALSTLSAVVADGRLYTREQLDAQLAAYQSWFGGAVYDAVATRVVRRVLAGLFDEE